MRHHEQVHLMPNRGWDASILVCANQTLVNVFIVVTRRYVVIIDTLFNGATAARLHEMAAPYLDAGRTLMVANTHADYDHAWGNHYFAGDARLSPPPILAHRLCAARLAAPEMRAELAAFQAKEPDIFSGVILTQPTLTVDGPSTLLGGDLTLHFLPTPGHTPDHLAVYIPEIATLLAGDAAEWPFPFAASPTDLPALRASLATLAALKPRHALYCHADPTTGPALLLANLAYFATVEAACRRALAAGLPYDVPVHDLIAAVNCSVTDALPNLAGWPLPDAADLTIAHAQQLRDMLTWLRMQRD